MPRVRDMEVLTTEEAFNKLKVDQLKALVPLLGEEPPQHKADLVEILTRTMQEPQRVRELYAHDRRLRDLCHLAGQRHLVFRAADEKASAAASASWTTCCRGKNESGRHA